ncbi:MAG: lysophospholipid acyltransferase family protein [Myxococcaceae bacterium]
MSALVTAVFWLLFAVTSPIAFVLGVLLWAVSAPFDPDRRLLHAFLCRWSFQYLGWNPGWDIRVLHRERLPAGAAVLVANHQSMADIVAVMGLFHPFKFVSKASLFSLPMVGWLMTLARYVRLERGKAHSTARMMTDCRFWLARGMPVLIFPEGTYSPDGKLLPFKVGAAVLAITAKVPIVPVLIEGTRSLVIEDGPWMSPRCRVRVTVLPPIEAAELGEDEQELTARVRKLFEPAGA